MNSCWLRSDAQNSLMLEIVELKIKEITRDCPGTALRSMESEDQCLVADPETKVVCSRSVPKAGFQKYEVQQLLANDLKLRIEISFAIEARANIPRRRDLWRMEIGQLCHLRLNVLKSCDLEECRSWGSGVEERKIEVAGQ